MNIDFQTKGPIDQESNDRPIGSERLINWKGSNRPIKKKGRLLDPFRGYSLQVSKNPRVDPSGRLSNGSNEIEYGVK